MPALNPDYMTLDYRCQYRGIPGLDHDPGYFPMDWTVSVDGMVWDEGEEDNDGREVHVGDARFSIVPDAGLIDLFMTLDAVDQELANVAEMLTVERPDLMPDAEMELGGDLLVLSSLWIDPAFRGHKLGHAILRAILGTVGRAAALVILQASPVLTDDGPEEGSPEHAAAKDALRRYWADYGFQIAARDYLVAGAMVDAFDV
jgi:GNAT superfamily N-acetyltransferase